MKKALVLFFLLGGLFYCAAAHAYTDTPSHIRLTQTASGRGIAYVTEVSDGWKFGGKRENAFAEDYDDSLWATVNLPHTWNATDAADGDGKYERTTYWYRKNVTIDTPFDGKRIYLEFLGANQKTDLYVNGTHIKLSGSDEYTHKGGYTAFRYDITNELRLGGNMLAVKVDNAHSEEIAPISADFNIYGGIYRRVYLITVDEVHVDLSSSGSSGFFLTTPNVRSLDRPDDLGTLILKTKIVNEGAVDRTVTITAHIEGDNAPEDIVRTVTVPEHGSAYFNETMFVSDPHLWRGIDYSGKTDNSDIGYRYLVSLTLSEDGKTIDAVSDTVGFRYFWVDKDTGFYLNGESHPLRGVNRHQFKQDMGNAILEAEHEEDIRQIIDLGANAVRLSHYPQTDYFYDLCDQYGILLWTEIPLVNAVGTKEGFMDVTMKQLTELIRQQYNRPSICFWGLENEVKDNLRNEYYTAKTLMNNLNNLAHELDTTGRYTAQAVNVDITMDEGVPELLTNLKDGNGWPSDLMAWNIYPGWYNFYPGTFEELVEEKTSRDSRPMALSEYGWGGSVTQHERYPVLGKNDLLPTGKWHPEEYQNLMHEEAIKSINSHDELWATFIWCMFDFDVDSRNEGSRAAQNDKGLVTNDRTIRKDSFYLYKANWDKREPFVYITSSRYKTRTNVETYVKVYSNCESVTLYKNGVLLGPMESLGNGIFLLEGVELDLGENKMLAVGTADGQTCEDTCIWIRVLCDSTDLISGTLPVDNAARTVSLPGPMAAGEVKRQLTGADHASYRIMLKDREVTDDSALIYSDMTLEVCSESGAKKRTFSIIPQNLFTGKIVWASSIQNDNNPQNAIDGDSTTRWVAENDTFPQNITVDLGDVCDLGTLMIDWYTKGNRYYAYLIEVSEDGENYVTVANCIENKITGTTRDDLRTATARYVRIIVLSCSQKNGYASIFEMRLGGWKLHVPDGRIDNDFSLIIVPETEGQTAGAFFGQLKTSGNCRLLPPEDPDAPLEGAAFTVMDMKGQEHVYTVTTPDNSWRYPMEVAQSKPVFFSSEEGKSSDNKTDTHAANLVDGLESTAWVADTKVNGTPGKRADYPEWIGVDLGREYALHGLELLFEGKGGRMYQYRVFVSSDTPLVSGKQIPSDYTLLIDQSGNDTFNDGRYAFTLNGEKARYVAIEVLGNSLYPKNRFAAASIRDLKVFATAYIPDEKTEE